MESLAVHLQRRSELARHRSRILLRTKKIFGGDGQLVNARIENTPRSEKLATKS